MTAWGTGRILVLDTETTGTDVESDRIVTACAAVFEAGEPSYRRSWLVAVDVDIPDEAAAVHGITTDKARAEGRPADQVIPEIAGAVRYAVTHGMPVAIFNAPFDLTILDRELSRWAGSSLAEHCGSPIGPVIDPLCVDRAVDRYRPGKRQLAVTCEQFGIKLDGAHEAGADVDATGALLWQMWLRSQAPEGELMRLYGDRKFPRNLVRDWRTLGQMGVGELHAAQVGWYRDQSESFAQYLVREANQKKHEADVARERGDDEAATIARQEADELFARADGVGTVWPYKPVEVSA